MDFPSSVTVTGQSLDLSRMYDAEKALYISLAKDIAHAFSHSGKNRVVFGFAGVSGAGKSTLTAIVKELLKTESFRTEQLSIDAYHYTNKALGEKNLLTHKGRYDTYDVDLLIKDLSQFKDGDPVHFPEYSRNIHEPVQQGGSVWSQSESGILLLEGLWLLYTEGTWVQIKDFIDVSYFVEVDAKQAEERTVARHIRGGRPEKDAELFYTESDMINTGIVQTTSVLADHILKP